MKIAVDGERLLGDLAELARHGRAPGGGWTRPALSPADAAARRYVAERGRALGLAVAHDEVGNLRMRRAGSDAAAAPVLTGSHLDTVPSGGYLDGPLGLEGALGGVGARGARR